MPTLLELNFIWNFYNVQNIESALSNSELFLYFTDVEWALPNLLELNFI